VDTAEQIAGVILLIVAFLWIGFAVGWRSSNKHWQRAVTAQDENWRAILNAVQAGERINFVAPEAPEKRRRLRRQSRSR